jgi:single-stranded-DNA-specific exonuclease
VVAGTRVRPTVSPSFLSMYEGTWTVRPCPRREVRALAEALDLSETTASVLVRRGYGDPDRARAFLAAEDPRHDPLLLGDASAACDAIGRTIAAGRRICVHGDYDVDGICATALAVSLLRSLGADVSWHLPSRFEEGYGVSGATLTRLAEEGCGLVLTVDCGITSVAEVAEAKTRGLDVVVTDHHRPGETLPDCPVVAPRPSSYPFAELCGTGVVYKLFHPLVREQTLREHADLVALATVGDVVPLVDENRALVTDGLRRLARTTRPGLRALMHAARVDPATVDAGAIAFRLAPRINAAGRLGHPRAALDLLLTEDGREAEELAVELENLNRDRQAVEDRILRDALRQVTEWPEAARRRRGYVLAGEDWHRGVVGIVASRLVERFHRPVILVAGGEGEWVGSGRSIPTFDLHAALAACADYLGRWGGHRAAAGLSMEPGDVEPFARAFADHADAFLAEGDLEPRIVVDAVVDGRDLTLGLCEELERLAPFGLGNPGVTLLAAGCQLSELGAVGEGKHLKLAVTANGARSGAIAFGQGEWLDRYRRPGRYDIAFRLDANRWNGTVTPQLVVKRIFATPEGFEDLRLRLLAEWRAGPERWSAQARQIFEELGLVDEPAARRRPLAESETFRAALADRLAAAA